VEQDLEFFLPQLISKKKAVSEGLLKRTC